MATKILVIDDDQGVQETLKMILTNIGFIVEIAVDGKEGTEKFDAGNFDLVITDICMPGKNGNEVAQYIRDSKRRFTPIIGITGSPWLLEEDKFDMVIPKPFQVKSLIDTVISLSLVVH
jgi:DNA-binding response OmpR family regulator